ncbi:MAG TPA: 2-oxoacid:ferredoxin oxidoreductase subunit beta [Thermotogota bacterium]|nr:2-oxoacid:ferredoxin oxidoreductase subunit beta [Thermotogota bacterium]HPJ90185.1 2-oxoacid:ferredoxin oxidoreductase subunit beta [Thermotogota bacterium]HPR95555.1 2-oxoacid:ferredoxin oxidoreductase subunit beta [Thermotogota bacterium]
MSLDKYLKHLRVDRLPHVWCPGCGNGTVLKATVGAIEELGLDPSNIAVVSGIGCSSRATGYLNYNTMHTLHGRAIAFATGIKLSRPEMKVLVMTGDGDCGAIGGNHFIHAARRNMDITVIGFNNNIYGMTGGQYSPTTPESSYATTSPYGNIEQPFDLSRLAITAGATYVARSTSYHFVALQNYIKKAITNEGFSFVETVVQCPTYYGRYNKKGTAPQMINYFKENGITLNTAVTKLQEMYPDTDFSGFNVNALLEKAVDNLDGKIILGEFVNKSVPGYVEKYKTVVEKAQAEAKAGR